MRILVQNEWRIKAIFGTILLMIGGLFISRVLLSVGMMLFVCLTILRPQLKEQFRRFLRTPYLLSLSLLFFIPFVSGLWSNDINGWLDIMAGKIPFLLLPLAFAGDWTLKEKERRLIAGCFILFAVIACCWSILLYIREINVINESYLRAKTIPVLMDNDHVRFSWTVCIAVMLAVFFLERTTGVTRRLLLISAVLMTVYLHVLSARTGLVIFYIFAFSYTLYKLRKRPGVMLLVFFGLLVMLTAAWCCFPTLSNRIKYNLYDLSLIKNNEYRSGTSDGNRVASIRAGWALLEEYPLTGVGAGDIRTETGRWYDRNVAGIKETDKLYPSNEWLVYGCMAGIPGLLLFTGIVLLPLYIRNTAYRFWWILFHATAIILFLVETSLEIQYGIFIYTFFGLCWWKWHCFEKSNKPGTKDNYMTGMPERQ